MTTGATKPGDTRPAAPHPGDELPALTIPLTRTLIVAGALASRDFQDVHHDPEAARAKGSPEIFMNILTTNGLVGRYITDHFGPRCTLRKVAIRLGAPNYPGDTMVLRGTVTEVTDGTAVVRVVGTNGIGHHVTGTVTVALPESVPEGIPEGVPEGILEGIPEGAPERAPDALPEDSPEDKA
ncbi:MaoC family dehydratase [Streptomyces platensis]|uniref:MaoC family dehydratase n=1 Tax=Streptomyces platensis TaxID=58346 RepID=UPI002E823E1E|nr:MaoC family dehydratase [Streptomyces platensis]WUB80901.1 MaoC family dehydratase [Streptomyces platensis]